MNQITLLLQACQQGQAAAPNQLLSEVYAELRRVAAAKMARELPGQTLQATALVHEAWLKLGDASFQNRAHFFGAAAEAMRRILIDRARKRRAVRHGSGQEHVELDDDLQIAAPAVQEDELLAVHEALDKLAAEDARKAELVKLHYFVGLTFAEAAEVLGVRSPRQSGTGPMHGPGCTGKSAPHADFGPFLRARRKFCWGFRLPFLAKHRTIRALFLKHTAGGQPANQRPNLTSHACEK